MVNYAFAGRSQGQWDKWASGWDTNPRRLALNDQIMTTASEQLGPPPRRVLDAGSGSGHYARWLMERGYLVMAVDQSLRMVTLTEEKLCARGGNCYVGDANALAFPDGCFDAVLALTLIEWVADPVTLVQELARVIRPGGRISLGVLGAGSRVRDQAYRRFHGDEVMNTAMPWEVARLLDENGWQLVSQCGIYRKRHARELIEQLDERLRMCVAFIWFIGAIREPD